MQAVKNPEEIEDALSEYYSELAKFIVKGIQPFNFRTVIEIGAGSGRFTIPVLAELKNRFEKFHCIDSYTWPYANGKENLESKLREKGLEKKVEIIKIDAGKMDGILSDADLIIGHEVLCDLNLKQVAQVLQASYNVLKDGGRFIHSEFSPNTQNRSEELVKIINNEYSAEPISDTKWFSPSADELAGTAQRIGFKSIVVEYKKIPIRFVGDAAMKLIEDWRINPKFFEKFENEVRNIGIEYPMEQIFSCVM